MKLAVLVCVLATWAVPAATSEPATARNGLIVYVHQAPRNPNALSVWVIVDESGFGIRRLFFGPEQHDKSTLVCGRPTARVSTRFRCVCRDV